MRVSVSDTPRPYLYDVYLDGHPVRWCLAADDGEGWVDVLVAGADGQPAPPGEDGAAPTRRRYGKVELTFEGHPVGPVCET